MHLIQGRSGHVPSLSFLGAVAVCGLSSTLLEAASAHPPTPTHRPHPNTDGRTTSYAKFSYILRGSTRILLSQGLAWFSPTTSRIFRDARWSTLRHPASCTLYRGVCMYNKTKLLRCASCLQAQLCITAVHNRAQERWALATPWSP